MNIGLLAGSFKTIKPNSLVTGFQIATNDLTEAFIQYADNDSISMLYDSILYQKSQIIEHISALNPCLSLNLIDEYDILFHGANQLKKIDVFHSVKEDALALLELRKAAGSRIPITFTIHSLPEQHLLFDTFLPLILLPFKEYDAIICTSEAVRNTLGNILNRCEKFLSVNHEGSFSSKIRLEKVHLGVDIDYFKPKSQIEARKHMKIPADSFVILWFGRFSDIFKADLYPLLFVFSQLKKKNPKRKLILLLAGSKESGSDYDKILMQQIDNLEIQENVRFIANQDIKDRSELYSASDVFTSPIDNLQETFGLTPIEAMACGVPQIVSDWDGYRDTVVSGETGFRIPTIWSNCMGDVLNFDMIPLNSSNRRLFQRYLAVRSVVVDCEIYEEKFQYLLDHPEECVRMGKISREYAVEHFSLEHTVEETKKVWKKLVSMAKKTTTNSRNYQILTLDYCHDFINYPTHMLSDEDIFELTISGRNMTIKSLPQYQIFLDNIEEAQLCESIVEVLFNCKCSILSFAKKYKQYTLFQIRRSFLFLYKYGMIRRDIR